MKLLISFFFALAMNLNAQNFNGKAIYELSINSKSEIGLNLNIDPQMKAFIENKLKNAPKIKYELIFNKNNSIFFEQKTVNINNNENSSWSPYGIDISYFKDLKKKEKILNKDLMGKVFNVIDSLPNYKWHILNEFKLICGYNCIKASTEIFNEDLEKKENIIAWFAIDIPINNGPKSFWNLPGLILEINSKEENLICTKIILNLKKYNKIKKDKGEDISKTDFDFLVKKKMDELEKVDFTK